MLNKLNDFSIDESYQVEVAEVGDRAAITLPCGLKSKTLPQSFIERHFFGKAPSANDHVIKELFPTQFSFDFDMTIEAWKDLVICERRAPFETTGLTKKEAEWAWILIEQWAANPVDSKFEFLEMYYDARQTFEALGWDSYLDQESQEKLTDLFSIKNPILVNYKPSKKIMQFYRNIWSPLKNKLQNT